LINRLVDVVVEPRGVLALPVSANSTVIGVKFCEAVVHTPLVLQVLVMVLSAMLLAPEVRVSVAAPVVPNGEQFVLIPPRFPGKEPAPVLTHHS
jgi:hypothetical protein